VRKPRRETDEHWSREELAALGNLSSPGRIQAFLDSIEYSADPIYRCPRSVLRDRRGHCFDGAALAAAALKRLGFPPLLINMRAVRDDDHVLAVLTKDGCVGAIGKSNFVGLRFREPIYRSPRELVMSYFEHYYNVAAEKTMRAYSVTLDLDRIGTPGWETSDAAMDVIALRLEKLRHYPLLTPAQEKALLPVDQRSLDAGLLGVNPAGLFKL
jgi:hypothetical protein